MSTFGLVLIDLLYAFVIGLHGPDILNVSTIQNWVFVPAR